MPLPSEKKDRERDRDIKVLARPLRWVEGEDVKAQLQETLFRQVGSAFGETKTGKERGEHNPGPMPPRAFAQQETPLQLRAVDTRSTGLETGTRTMWSQAHDNFGDTLHTQAMDYMHEEATQWSRARGSQPTVSDAATSPPRTGGPKGRSSSRRARWRVKLGDHHAWGPGLSDHTEASSRGSQWQWKGRKLPNNGDRRREGRRLRKH